MLLFFVIRGIELSPLEPNMTCRAPKVDAEHRCTIGQMKGKQTDPTYRAGSAHAPVPRRTESRSLLAASLLTYLHLLRRLEVALYEEPVQSGHEIWSI